MKMIRAKIVFGLMVFLMLFAGCDKKAADATDGILIICDSTYVLPTESLVREFKGKTGIDAVITVAAVGDILALVKIGKEGDVLIVRDPFVDQIINAGVHAANARVGIVPPSGTQEDTGLEPRRIYAVGLNYSENSMAIMQFIEFARDRGSDIFAKHGYEK
jgi:ABC-type molybdate transport system substrate-binding protein